MLDYICEDGEWSYTDMTPRELFVTNLDRTKSQINQEEVTVFKKHWESTTLRPEETKSTSSIYNKKPQLGQTE